MVLSLAIHLCSAAFLCLSDQHAFISSPVMNNEYSEFLCDRAGGGGALVPDDRQLLEMASVLRGGASSVRGEASSHQDILQATGAIVHVLPEKVAAQKRRCRDKGQRPHRAVEEVHDLPEGPKEVKGDKGESREWREGGGGGIDTRGELKERSCPWVRFLLRERRLGLGVEQDDRRWTWSDHREALW
ncbi:unnamed protein product [Gadus morhua 'NCC']